MYIYYYTNFENVSKSEYIGTTVK